MTSSPAQARRNLRFADLDAILADVDELVQAERRGQLARAGNWTLGQTLNHLAYWAEGAYVPIPVRLPLPVRLFTRLFKHHFLRAQQPTGVRIPGIREGTLATEDVPLDQALARFTAIMDRLKHDPPTQPSPALGILTRAQWILLTCRHAELHLSFQVPRP